MAVPEDMGRYLSPGELLPGRDLLDPSLLSQPVYSPENRLDAQVSGAPAGKEPLLAGLQALLDGLQSSLAHLGGPEVAVLGPGRLQDHASICTSMCCRSIPEDKMPVQGYWNDKYRTTMVQWHFQDVLER